VNLAVTIDAEADDQWAQGGPLTTRNVSFWAPFIELCRRHGVKPTFLATSEILEDPYARKVLRRLCQDGNAEVGGHLHPWTTPPYLDEPGLRFNDAAHSFPCELSDDLLAEKLITLSAQVTECAGIAPTSFRAGRFGLDGRCVKLLGELGYAADSSVTPCVSWRDQAGLPGFQGGPDFRTRDITPSVVWRSGQRAVVELPVTIAYSGPLAERHALIPNRYVASSLRVADRVTHGYSVRQPIWMRPYPRTRGRDLVELWRIAAARGVGTAVMMFHSSELMPGGSPYRPTPRSVAALLALLDRFFAFVRAEGGAFLTLTEAAGAAAESPLLLRPL